MTEHVEINNPVECEVYIGHSRVGPTGANARTCRQCGHATWSHTSACMWCGHDRANAALRWLIAAACLAVILVNIPAHF